MFQNELICGPVFVFKVSSGNRKTHDVCPSEISENIPVFIFFIIRKKKVSSLGKNNNKIERQRKPIIKYFYFFCCC